MSDGAGREPGIDKELARRIAHEIRSPLGVILGAVKEVSGREDVPRDAVAFLQLAGRSVGRLERLVQRLEWLATLHADALEEPAQPEALRDVVERGIKDAEAWAGRRAIAVEIVEGRDATARVRSSRALRQIVQELVHNAIRHARARVTVSIVDEGTAPRIRIHHDGTALDPERLLGTKPSSQHPSGLGIGLWLCRELAGRIGATLRADVNGVTVELGP